MESKESVQKPALINQKVKQIVWLLFAVTVLVLVIGYFQMQTMSAVRAYVYGESLWAKGERDAIAYLKDYLRSPSETTYLAYQQALTVNLSDKKARLALQKKPPDREAAFHGLLGGANHPDDIPGMIRLFVWFQDLYPMKPAISVWTEADKEIEKLQTLANRIYETHQQDPTVDLMTFRSELDVLNSKLNGLEIAFSNGLGEGARWLKTVFLIVNVSMLLTAVAIIGIIARRVIKSIDETESELRLSESRFKTLYDSNVIGILVWGTGGELYDANDKYLNMLGYSKADLLKGRLNWRDTTPEDWIAADNKALEQISNLGWSEPYHKEYYHQSGKRVPVFIGGALLDGSSDKGVAFVVDRSNEKEMETQLRLSATVLEASRDAILICDNDKKVLKANEAYYQMTGLKHSYVVGKSALLVPKTCENLEQSIESSLKNFGYWQGDIDYPLADSSTLPVRASISRVASEKGTVNNYVAVFTDISARKALERDLKAQAHYDHLTGLANRSLYSDRLDTAINRAQRHKKQCALLFIDLDKFKPVNDQYGHEMGDLLLQKVAQRMETVSRKSDTVGRLGGDEFVVILEDLDDPNSVSGIADKIIESLNQPFSVQGHEVSIGCSVGAAIYPDHGNDGESLTRSADIAMYAAKASRDTDYYLYRLPPDIH